MDQIIERIKEAYQLETDAEVANFLDIKPSTLSMQKNRGKLNLHRILKKCNDLNKNWLFSGEGAIRGSNGSSDKAIPIYSSIVFEDGRQLNHNMSTNEGYIQIATGENLDGLGTSKKLLGYIIGSESMKPLAKSDDIVLVDTTEVEPQDGAFFLFSHDQSILCRRIEEQSNGQYFGTSDNSGNDSFEMPIKGNSYFIIGKIVGVLHHF